MKTIRIKRLFVERDKHKGFERVKAYGTIEEAIDEIRKITPTAKIPEWSLRCSANGDLVVYKGKGYPVYKALQSKEIPKGVKVEIEETLEELYVYPTITPPRQQFEGNELIEIDVKVSNKAFAELLDIFKFFKVPYKPKKEGIEIKYYPKEALEESLT